VTELLRIRWVGHPADSLAASIDAACCEVLRRVPELRLVSEGETADVVVMTDGMPRTIPGRWCVHYPLQRETFGHMRPAWAASSWHQTAFGPEAAWIPLPEPTSLTLAADLARWDWPGWAQRVLRALQRLCRPPVRVRLTACVVANATPVALQKTLADVRGVVDEIVVVHGGDSRQAELAAHFGATVLTADVGRQAEARGVAADAASGLWLLLMEAGETIIGGYEPLDQIRSVAPQGPDIALIDLHDAKAAVCGPYLAPRLIARWAGLRWQGPAPEGLERPAGGAVLVLPFGLQGVQSQPRPELRGALANAGMALLRQSLFEAPDNPQVHFHLGMRFRQREDWRQASRHLDAALGYSNLVGRWPQFALVGLEARAEIATHLGHLALAESLLEMPPKEAVERPEFWVARAYLDWRLGRLDAAAGAAGKGWDVLGDRRDLPGTRQRLALLAADLCMRQEQFEAGANWLMAAVAERRVDPQTIAGWCRWLQLAGQQDQARRVAQAVGGLAWESAKAVEPILSLAAETRPQLTVILVVAAGMMLRPDSLRSAAQLGDEVIMVVPQASQPVDVGGPYGFRTLAVDGSLREGVMMAGRAARGQWLFLLNADEWVDDVTIRLIHQAWNQVGLAQGLTVNIHGAIEAESPEPGAADALRLVRPSVVAGLDKGGRNWLVSVGSVLRQVAGAIVWQDHGAEVALPSVVGLETARRLMQAGEVDAAIIEAQAWLAIAIAGIWPMPSAWRGAELLADLYRLQGDEEAVERYEALLADMQPCVVRPWTGKFRVVPMAPAAVDLQVPDVALSVVDAIRTGRVDSAVRQVDEWVRLAPGEPAVWAMAARVHLEAANLDAAEAALRRCLLLRAVRPMVPAWFPGLHGIPEGLLGRCFLARGEARRALGWLLPMLARYSADVEMALSAFAAAWLCGEAKTVAEVVGWLDQMTPIEERADLDQALAGAATEYGWPAKNLHDWQDWCLGTRQSL
jgi:tetratricopeptide (TPR) repeat protein